jgi:hypothetical protein
MSILALALQPDCGLCAKISHCNPKQVVQSDIAAVHQEAVAPEQLDTIFVSMANDSEK